MHERQFTIRLLMLFIAILSVICWATMLLTSAVRAEPEWALALAAVGSLTVLAWRRILYGERTESSIWLIVATVLAIAAGMLLSVLFEPRA